MARWSFINSLNGFTTIPFGTIDLPGVVGGGGLTVVTSLYVNGVSKVPFADISGWTVMRNPQSFAGDGSADVLWMGSGSNNVAIIWDERTTEQGVGGPFFDMYEGYGGDAAGNNIRYGLPGGSFGEETASFETILGGDAHDFINLSYNGGTFNYTIGGVTTPVAGRAYQLDITIDVGAGRDLVIAGEGNDVIYGGDENLDLGDGLMGMGGNDTIYGGRNVSSIGADDLYGYAGNDTIYGANSGEVYYGDSGDDVIYGGGAFGFDPGSPTTLVGATTDNTFYGGDGDDLMIAATTFSQSREFFFGGNPGIEWVDEEFVENNNGVDDSLNDTVSYAAWSSTIVVDLQTNLGHGTGAAGAALDQFVGIEHLIGGSGNDTLTGSSVANRLEGRSGNDTLFGEAGSDTLIGGLGDDRIDAGADDDLVEGGVGSDSLIGGTGNDTLSYSLSADAVNVTLGGAGTGGDAQGDTVAGDFENLLGSAFNDTLVGSSIANTIIGGFGLDTIEGGLGDDVLAADESALPDSPGSGDWLSYNGAAAPGVQASLFAGTSTGSAGNDLFAGFQHLLGSNLGNDFLEGSDVENTIIGQGGNDTLSGLGGIDTVYGGAGDDTVLAGTNGGTFDVTVVNGWDGEDGSAPIAIDVALGAQRVSDLVFGGIGTDTMDMAQLLGEQPRTVFNSPNSNFASFLVGVEIIIAGSAADIINLTFNDGVTRSAYGESVTVFAGANSDIVFSGAANDLVVGGRQNGVDEGEAGDTLYGGAGSDIIFGDDFNNSAFGGDDRLFGGLGSDSIYGGVGNDTVYGGTEKDIVFGGTGDDLLIDGDDAELYGGDGGDVLLMDLADLGSSESLLYGGADAFGDGNDLVYVTGFYAKVDSALGAGNDTFISYAIGDDGGGNSGDRVDRVSGQSGDDLVSTWFGDDSIDGGDGSDALWGGAGGDTIVGGAGSDFLYGGEGNNDTIFGGGGQDYYYWARIDGTGDQIFDEFRGTGNVGQSDNILNVFAGYDVNGVLPAGTGLIENDGTITDNAGGDDMVRAFDVDGAGSGTIWRLEILQGVGAGTYVEFDHRDIDQIRLWNHDSGPGAQGIQTYDWNGTTYVLI